MILVLFLLGFLILIFLILFLILLSNLEINFEEIDISNVNRNVKKQNKFKLVFKLYLFDKIPIFKIKIDEKRLSKFNIKEKIKKINILEVKKEFKFDKNMLSILKKVEIKIKKFNLMLDIGTQDAVITSFIVFFVSTLISIILGICIKKYDGEKYQYIITPHYTDKNIYKIRLDCIINVKMAHIIYMIFLILKKRGVDKNERASNRRSYDYSYG